jgi:uncharacterized protein
MVTGRSMDGGFKGRKLWFLAGCIFVFYIILGAIPGLSQAQQLPVFILDFQGNEVCRFDAQTAVGADEQTRGLMFRKYMPHRTGMIFINNADQVHHFWMKNTYIPLDMIFIDGQYKIVHIHYNARPHDEAPISSVYPARYILEVNAGEAKDCSIQRGWKVRFGIAGK